jgi:hypothetical protein
MAVGGTPTLPSKSYVANKPSAFLDMSSILPVTSPLTYAGPRPYALGAYRRPETRVGGIVVPFPLNTRLRPTQLAA